MSDIDEAIQGAADAVLEELDLLWQDLTKPSATDNTDAAQRKTRANYEAVAQAPPDQADAARQQFDAQYGPSEWQRQQTLHVRRDAKAGQNG